jgi:hypothetical protein
MQTVICALAYGGSCLQWQRQRAEYEARSAAKRQVQEQAKRDKEIADAADHAAFQERRLIG